MRVLLIAWYFPPHNDVGALRSSALASYLASNGHDIRVLSAKRNTSDNSLGVPLKEDWIVRTPWLDVDSWSIRREDGAPKAVVHASPLTPGSSKRSAVRAALGIQYRNFVRMPDRQIGWLPYLRAAGDRILASQKFDLIFASGPPFTTFLGARSLSKKFGVPWFAEYRDAWFEDQYGERPAWRRIIDRHFENLTVRSARGIVAVSEPWAKIFSARFPKKPVIAVYNGFDEIPSPGADRAKTATQPLSITYTGVLYDGKRNPSCLYRALKLSHLTPEDVQVHYYGPSANDIFPLAQKFGVVEFVRLFERVSYTQSIDVQRQSDILLLLQPSDDKANVPAKFFEYIATRRPILGLGLDAGIPAKIIRSRSAGQYDTHPESVAEQLKLWVAQKRRDGYIPDLSESVAEGLSRREQLDRLINFLKANIGLDEPPTPALKDFSDSRQAISNAAEKML